MQNRILWTWTLGEIVISALLAIVGLTIVPLQSVYKFDHSVEIILAVSLVLAVATGIVLIATHGLTKLSLVVAIGLMLFDGILIVIGFFVAFGELSVWMRNIEDAWQQSSFAEAVRSFEASHNCCGLRDEVQPPCEANFSCYTDLKNEVKGVCNAVGTGILAVGFVTLPQGVMWFVVWLYRRKKEELAAAKTTGRMDGLVEEQHPVLSV
jgi:hypothetical protein